MAKTDVVRDALLSVLSNVGHYREHKKKPPYCVWAEDGAIGLRGDNGTVEQALTGTVHYFTLRENDPNIQKIQIAFNAAGISWYLNSIQYEDEDDAEYIHYEWAWSIG